MSGGMSEHEGSYGLDDAGAELDEWQARAEAAERRAEKLLGEKFVLQDQLARVREELVQIRDQDPVENALDPQWAARIAHHALANPTLFDGIET